MAKKIGNLAFAGEKYQGSDGQERVRWIRCGVLLETDRGYKVKLDCVPLGGDGWLNCFPDDQHAAPRQAPAPRPAPAADVGFDDSSLPF